MKVGITGHQRLEHADTWEWVSSELRLALDKADRLTDGLSSLAIGADQVFANLVLERGCRLIAIIPCSEYELTFTSESDRKEYRRLLYFAHDVVQLSAANPDEEAFYAAGRRVVDLSNHLFAVWNGRPSVGLGGTADIVSYARRLGRPVTQIEPVHRTVTVY